MSLKHHFELMAHYNQWMNDQLYEAAAQLDNYSLMLDRGAFFGSILGTLNHILVGDTLWLQRFARHSQTLESLQPMLDIPTPGSLDAALYDTLEELYGARRMRDNLIIAFSQEAEDSHYLTPLRYRNSKQQLFEKQFGYLVQHFYNHQTHHRGQVTTLLSQVGIDVGITDLLALVPEFE
ncbi:damage-inducible protein DinB [Pokkaliibacter plantistimulans]|uniref:Damage-inducible protein DinB n=1 Tax=Proteobacteria bacterium 228 TaxID=2083153 RepID=A0A2S5KQ84_9PROT|nr:DinB family protein [Pokkaliibacter plantistimulans]PPC76815.1 damage-inducible protein DinB [Pokkaliibacter plantistimulans]